MLTARNALPQGLCFRNSSRSSGCKQELACRQVKCSSKGFGEKPPPKPEAKKTKKELREPQPSSQLQPFSGQARPEQDPQSSGRPPIQEVREVPEAINQRMLNRMLIFSLLPVLLGFISLPLLAYIQVSQKVELPQGTAFVISGLFFGAGLLGITYGILSASWDENEEGSGLGFTEFKSNTAPLIDKIKDRR